MYKKLGCEWLCSCDYVIMTQPPALSLHRGGLWTCASYPRFIPRFSSMDSIQIDLDSKKAPTRDQPNAKASQTQLPAAKSTKTHPKASTQGNTNASLLFVGTATTILEWNGLRLMTDPNFLHAGDHVHLGPGVTSVRKTNPFIDLHDLPPMDMVLLSHYHEDHFDREVEASLRRDLPVISTPHAKEHLAHKDPPSESFTAVTALDFWDSTLVSLQSASFSSAAQKPHLKVTGTPGKHVPDGILNVANEILKAVPPTNGWMLELGYLSSSNPEDFQCGYRIYISGDTLFVSDLKQIPEMYTHAGKPVDLMLVHLGGTTIPGPNLPLLMVTMDAKQGVQLMQLIQPEVTVPIHYE